MKISLDLIPSMSAAERTFVRAFLIILWKEIFAMPDTREARATLDKIEDLMSALDPEVIETSFDIDLSQSPILVEDFDDEPVN